jgi:hypothetical protein
VTTTPNASLPHCLIALLPLLLLLLVVPSCRCCCRCCCHSSFIGVLLVINMIEAPNHEQVSQSSGLCSCCTSRGGKDGGFVFGFVGGGHGSGDDDDDEIEIDSDTGLARKRACSARSCCCNLLLQSRPRSSLPRSARVFSALLLFVLSFMSIAGTYHVQPRETERERETEAIQNCQDKAIDM